MDISDRDKRRIRNAVIDRVAADELTNALEAGGGTLSPRATNALAKMLGRPNRATDLRESAGTPRQTTEKDRRALAVALASRIIAERLCSLLDAAGVE